MEGAANVGGIALLWLKGACRRRGRTVQLQAVPADPKTCRGKTTMSQLPRHTWAGAASLVLAITFATSASAQKADKDSKDNQDSKRPKITLKAQPVISMAPSRVVLTAELV